MSAGIRAHVRSNIVGYVALFFALGLGTAWAASELERNSVKSKHIARGQVKRSDLARRAVDSSKVADGSLQSSDFASGQLPAGPRGSQGPPGEPGAPGRDGILDAIGRSDFRSFGCVPGASDPDNDPLECAAVEVTLSRPARVVLTGNADWGIYGGGAYAGECLFRQDGVPIAGGPVAHPGENDVTDTVYADDLDFIRGGGVGGSPADHLSHLSLSHVTGPVGPGTYEFAMWCGNTDDSISFKNTSISAVAISPE